MPDPFPVSGNIDPTTFPNLLVDLHRQGATGSLKINGPVHPKALYFRTGRILFGSSNDPRDQLGAILIESGRITREQLDEVNAKVGPGNPLAKVLAESGFVNQRELGDAARDKVERILSDVLSWSTGTFEFEDGVLPKGAVDLKLSTAKLLLAAVQRIPDRAFALRHLGGDMAVVLAPVPEAEDTLEDVRADVWPLLERLDGQRTLQDAVALTRFDEFEAAKTACAMLFLGIVKRGGATADGELDLAQEAQSGFTNAPPGVAPEGGEPPAEPGPGPTASGESGPLVIPDPEPLSPEPVMPEALDSPVEGFRIPEPEPVVAEPLPDNEPPQPIPEAASEPQPAIPLPEPPAPAAEEPGGGFAFVGADDPLPGEPETPEPVPAVEPPPAAPAFDAEPLPPDAPSGPEGFEAAPPTRPTDTVPGDRPAYTPPPEPAGGEDAVAVEVPDPPPASPRPTKEDLAALDALLNPGESGSTGAAPRPKAEKWEPQFRPGTTPPGRRVVGRRSESSHNKLYAILGGVAILVLGAAAAGYVFLGGPAEPTPVAEAPSPPAVRATPTPAPPPPTTTLAPNPDAAAAPPDGLPAAAPEASTPPDPTAQPAGAPAVPAPTPTPAPPAPAPAAAAAPAGDAHALLRQGDLDGSARQSAADLSANAAGRFAIQALVACSPETVQKAVAAVADDQLFILPVNYKGRDCHRICWGVFDDRGAAEAAARSFPAYFRENGISPRIQPLVDLLP